MNNISKLITTFTACKFIEEVTKPQFSNNLNTALNEFSEQCDFLGGDKQQFIEIVTRELVACRLFEDGEGGGAGASPAVSSGPTNVVAGIAGLKPEDLAIPVEAQKRHTSKNSIFRRKKPNKYFTDKENSY